VVQGWQRRDLQPRGGRRDLEEHRGVAVDGGDEDDVRLPRVQHRGDLAGQRAAFGPYRPGAAGGEGGDQLAAGDAGQQPGDGLLVAEPQQGAGRQRPGEQRRGHEPAAQLGEGDREHRVARLRAAVLRRDDQAAQPEAGHLLPRVRVERLP
jgi:hypothetical protein